MTPDDTTGDEPFTAFVFDEWSVICPICGHATETYPTEDEAVAAWGVR